MTDQYRKIFDEAIGPTPPSGVDVDGVVRRQRVAGRVRGSVAVAVAVAAVTAGVVAAIGATGDDRAAPPASPGPVTPEFVAEYFPPYTQGVRVIAEVWGPLNEERLTLTFTPSVPQADLSIFVRCEAGDPDVALDLMVGLGPGNVVLRDFCGQETFRPSPGWAAFAEVGTASTVSLAITGDDPVRPDGTFGLAVGEPVPFEEYPLPDPPDSLPPLDPELPAPELPAELSDPDARVEILADPADPARPVEATVEWYEEFLVGARAQTPGLLHLYVDGAPVEPMGGPLAVWDYAQEDVQRNLRSSMGWDGRTPPEPGTRVTVTVVPEHLTGDWVVVLDPVLPADPEE